MVAYKNISQRGTEADFFKIQSRDLPQCKNQKLGSTYFFQVKPHIDRTSNIYLKSDPHLPKKIESPLNMMKTLFTSS